MMPPVAILAGGLATRLRPATEQVPKALLDVAGRPFLHHQLTLLKARHVQHVVLCVGYLGDRIREYAGDGSRWGLTIDWSFDGDALLGTGGAVRRALPLLGELFWVMYGDSYLELELEPVLERFRDSGATALMTVHRNEGKYDRSNAVLESGRVVLYDKRVRDPGMCYIDYGLNLMKREAFRDVPEGPFDLADLLSALSKQGQLAGHEVRERFYEIGSPEGLEETGRYLSGKADPQT